MNPSNSNPNSNPGSNWKRSGLLYLAMLLGTIAIATILVSTAQKPTEIP